MNTADAGRPPPAAGWRPALLLLGPLLAWMLFLYRDTAVAMVAIWLRSGTFTHALLVPPISLWLIWRQRRQLAILPPVPARPALGLLLLAGAVWLLGELAWVNVLTQAALVALLVSAVPLLLGWRLTRLMAFPLGYLFFAVPIGEFLVPQFMDWTADFTVAALQFTGIPVYREGLQFVIPSGRWSVVEACSGVRYLIASLVVGTLYAHLNYRSWRRRLAFVAASLLVPIVANWLRAYLIVMIGHLSNNALAVGVDHLIYGWLFFGIVIMIMFQIGSRWAEPAAPAIIAGPAASIMSIGESGDGTAFGRLAALALAGACLVAAPPALHRYLTSAPLPPTPSLAIVAPAGWTAAADPAPDWQPGFSGAATELRRAYRTPNGAAIGLFLAYYRNQNYQRKLVSSENRPFRHDQPLHQQWQALAEGRQRLNLGGRPGEVATMRLRSPDGRQLKLWYWYRVDGRNTADPFLAKLHTALGRLAGHGDDGAAIVLFAPDNQSDEAALTAILEAGGEAIEQTLRNAQRQP